MGKLQVITEDTDIQYEQNSDLSYFDDGEDFVSVYVRRNFVGDAFIWKDSEMDEREYIVLNNEIIYLDTLNKF